MWLLTIATCGCQCVSAACGCHCVVGLPDSAPCGCSLRQRCSGKVAAGPPLPRRRLRTGQLSLHMYLCVRACELPVFLFVNRVMLISHKNYFRRVFEWLSLTWHYYLFLLRVLQSLYISAI